MKNLLYIFTFLAALCTVSCVKENFNEAEGGKTTFYGKAMNDDAVQVKTAVVNGHTVWSADDNIKVFYNGTSVEAELKTGENTQSATFEAAVGEATDYYAVYPASETATMTEDVMTVTIPAVQNGLFGAGHLAVAKAVDKTFSFVNVNAFYKITLATATYTKVVLESVAGEPLTGELNISFVEGEPVVDSEYQNTSSSVEVTSELPFAAGDLYFSVLPGVTHTAGLLIKCYNGSEQVGAYLLDKEVTTEASVTRTFDVFEPNGNYYVTPEGSGNNTGLSWENALSVSQMVALLQKSTTDAAACAAVDGAVFNFAEVKVDGEEETQTDYEYVLSDEVLSLAYETTEPIKLTFKSAGNVVFSGNETHSIMSLSGVDATFEGITFAKSYAVENECGALRASKSSLTLKNCKITGNSAADEVSGAGVCLDGCSSFVAENCEFSDNEASSSPALYLRGTNADVIKCNFEGNVAGAKVGVVRITGTHESNFTDCEFVDNHAWEYGMVQHVSGLSTFTNCNFKNNGVSTAKASAAFQLHSDGSGKLVVIGGEISGNEAGYGAAVNQENTGAELEMTDVVIKNNHVGKNGGAIWTAGKATLTRCVFTANTADGKDKTGGQCLTVAEGADLNMYGCTVQDHATTTSSTAIAVNIGAKLTVGAADSVRSLVQNNTGGWAGALKVQGEADIHDTDFIGNYAKGGGAINASDDGKLTLDGCLFEENYDTSNHGGAIRCESTNDFIVRNSTFRLNHNDATSNSTRGGAISTAKCNLIVDKCVFEKNYCNTTSGAAIAAEEETRGIKITNTKFIENYSGKNSGAIWLANHCDAEFEDCEFVGNYAPGTGGGAVRLDSVEGTIAFNRCHFEGNYATHGSAFYVYSWKSSLFLNACTFTGNYITGITDANVKGGTTIWLFEYGDFCMNNCTIADDTYVEDGTGAEACWIEANGCNTGYGTCLSNNTFIGSPRTSAGPALGGGLIRMDIRDWSAAEPCSLDNYYFINNILVTDEGNDAIFEFGNTEIRKGTMCYTKYSSWSGLKGSFTSVESPASEGFSKDSFNGLTWNADKCYWSWDGTMKSGNNTAKITKDQFVSTLTTANSSFASWLQKIGALDKDQLGNSRGSGEWWPGSYQKN